MSDTARDLIEGAMRLIGALATGEAASSDEASNGLTALNDLIDSWSTERLIIPGLVRNVFPLLANKQTYTMGTGGDFNSRRPQKIEQALIQFTNTSSPVVELPMRIVSTAEYAGIIVKGISSAFPNVLYSDNDFPTTTISIWPVPSTADYSLVLYSMKALVELATLSTALALPPGYQRALRYALAIDLAPEYGKAIPEAVAAIAEQSKAEIKRMNAEPRYLRVDDGLAGKPTVWNWRTGDPT